MPSGSKQQQKFMGMAHALKKGEMKPSDASPELKKVAKSMSDKDVKDFASTSHKGLPRKVKQELLTKLKEYANKMGTNTMGGDDYTSSKKGGLRDFDGYDNVDYNKDMPMDESMFSTIDQIRQNSKSVRDFIKNVLSDKDFRDMKSDKDFIKYLGSIYEGVVQESHYTAVANLGTKKSKENLDSFDELQKFMDKMKSRKAISVQVTKINGSKKQTIDYDWDGRNWVSKNKKGVQENFPANWMQGRTSDYHTKLRGKKKDYDDTNFEKDDSGQPDLKEENPCWDGYKQVGMKTKGGKQVPNCVKESINEAPFHALNNARFKKATSDLVKNKKIKNPETKKDVSLTTALNDKDHPAHNQAKSLFQRLKSKLVGEYGQKDLEEATKPDFNSKGYKEASKLVAKLRSSIFKKMNDNDLDQFRMVLAQSFDLKESLSHNEKEMVTGIIDILKQVKDTDNRKEIALKMIRQFKEENIDFDYSKFLNALKEYGSRLTDPYLLPKDEDKLKGTPPSKDTIDIELDEEAKRDYKAEYKKFQSSTKAKKYRAELNKYNRQKGTYGNGDGKDASHKGGKIVGFETESKNRGRREKSRLKKK